MPGQKSILMHTSLVPCEMVGPAEVRGSEEAWSRSTILDQLQSLNGAQGQTCWEWVAVIQSWNDKGLKAPKWHVWIKMDKSLWGEIGMGMLV